MLIAKGKRMQRIAKTISGQQLQVNEVNDFSFVEVFAQLGHRFKQRLALKFQGITRD